METFREFLAMDGYGVFVWPAYGLTIGLMVLAAFLIRRAHGESERTLAGLEKFDRRPRGGPNDSGEGGTGGEA